MDVSITGPDGASAYTGTEQTGGSFVVVLPSAGDYTLSVTGRKAAGTVSFARGAVGGAQNASIDGRCGRKFYRWYG